jgi:hypothetical protein
MRFCVLLKDVVSNETRHESGNDVTSRSRYRAQYTLTALQD